MRLDERPQGYGTTAKVLHWLTVVALAGQFVIGYTMSADDEALDRAEERLEAFEDRAEEEAEAQGEDAEERFEREIERREDAIDAREDNYVRDALSGLISGDGLRDGIAGPELHVLMGVTILILGVIRVVWRRTHTLPPWADYLSDAERTLEAWLEKALLALLFVVPGTGLFLVAAGEDWLPVHITAQMTMLSVVAVHVALVIKYTVVRRNRHLRRML